MQNRNTEGGKKITFGIDSILQKVKFFRFLKNLDFRKTWKIYIFKYKSKIIFLKEKRGFWFVHRRSPATRASGHTSPNEPPSASSTRSSTFQFQFSSSKVIFKIDIFLPWFQFLQNFYSSEMAQWYHQNLMQNLAQNNQLMSLQLNRLANPFQIGQYQGKQAASCANWQTLQAWRGSSQPT